MALTNSIGSSLSSLGNIVLGGVVRVLRPGAGGFPSPVTPYFAFRILDPVSGAVVIPNLPFLTAKWTVRGLQPGNVGASSLGSFEIGVPAPGTPKYQKNVGVLALLAEGQRVEAYLVPSPGVAPAGVPWQSGVIRALPSAFNDFAISGIDSLYLLQASRTGRTDFFTGRTDQLVNYALRTFQLAHGDDFALTNQLADSSFETPTLSTSPWNFATLSEFLLDTSGGNFHDGFQALKCTTTRTAVGWNSASPKTANALASGGWYIPITPNALYDMSIWAKASAGSKQNHYKVSWWQSIGVVSTIKSQDQAMPGTDGPFAWTQFSATVQAPADAHYALVEAMSGYWDGVTGTNGQNWFDDAHFSPTVEGPRYSPDSPSASLSFSTPGVTAGLWMATTDEGLAVQTVGGDSGVPSLLLTQSSFAQSVYADMVIDDYFRFRFANNVSVQHGLVAAYAGGGYVVGYMTARFVSAAKWEIDLVIASVSSSGVYTKRVTKTVVVVEPTQGMRAQLALIGKQGTLTGSTFAPSPTGPDYLWRLTINGVDAGCTWVQLATTPSGQIGLLYSTGASDSGTATAVSATTMTDTGKNWQSGIFVGDVVTMSGKTGNVLSNVDQVLTIDAWVGGTPSLSTYTITPAAPAGSPQLWATQFFMRSRLPAFQPGITNVGGRSILQYIPRTPGLDLLNYASVTEGNVYRKNARVGLNQDTIDWGPSIGSQIVGETPVGTDALVRFDKGKNLLDFQLEENSESLASDIALQVSPSGDQAGLLEWHILGAIKKYGILTDTVQAQYLADFLSARALAEAIGSTRSVPGVAKRFKVLRDKNTAGLWRELDYVVINWPDKGVVNKRVQIVEYTLVHGSPEVEVLGDKFPAADFGVELARLWQTLDQVAIGSASVTPSSVTAGVVYDSRFGSPNVLPFYGPYLSVDSTHNYRMRFQIPGNVVMIQKVTLAFSLLPYRTYSDFAVSSTGTDSVSHHHTHTHGGHTHTVPIDAGPFTNAIGHSAAGGNMQSGFGPTTAPVNSATPASDTTSGNTFHTHTVSGTSTLGIAEGTVAQGVHVFVDDVDITGALGGPWNGSGQFTDFGEFDITPYVRGGSWHEIQFSSTTLGAIVAQGMMFVIAKPTA